MKSLGVWRWWGIRRFTPWIAAVVFSLLWGNYGGAQQQNLLTMIARSDLVFQGNVENIEYRLSEPGGPEGTSVPYTYVTYRVVHLIRGSAGDHVTIRFIGGLDPRTDRYLQPSHCPQFDVGDEDILFVQGNTHRLVPLVDDLRGRLRVIDGQIYDENGHTINISADGSLITGARYLLAETGTTRVVDRVMISDPGPRAEDLPSNSMTLAELLPQLEDFARVAPLGDVPFVNADPGVAVPAPDMAPAPPPAPAVQEPTEPEAAGEPLEIQPVVPSTGKGSQARRSLLNGNLAGTSLASSARETPTARMHHKLSAVNLLMAPVFSVAVAPFASGHMLGNGKWSANTVTFQASSSSFPRGDAFRAALGTAVSRFRNNPSKFRFVQKYDDLSVAFNNGQNEVWFSSNRDHSPALCFRWYDRPGNIVEADVVIYRGTNYTASMIKTNLMGYGGSSRPFQNTILHEYGHAAGLGHENGEYNVMGQDWNHIHLNGTTCRSYLGEDACNGLVALYGLATSGFEDVSVTHWKYTGAAGAYSAHGQCKIYSNATGAELPYTTFSGQRRYNVTRGSTVRVEFSYENNGRTSKTPTIGFYLSADNTIATTDTLLKSFSMPLVRNNVDTRWLTVTIPANLRPGTTYYLGAFVDRTRAIGEVDEFNNAAYHIIQID